MEMSSCCPSGPNANASSKTFVAVDRLRRVPPEMSAREAKTDAQAVHLRRGGTHDNGRLRRRPADSLSRSRKVCRARWRVLGNSGTGPPV